MTDRVAVQCDIRGCVAPATTRTFVPDSDPKEVVDLCKKHASVVTHKAAWWPIEEAS